MTKNILVTGCAGFIGFNLAKTLINQNFNVIGIDSLNNAYDTKFKELRLNNLNSDSNFKFFNKDLSIVDSLNQIEDIDIVYHMGARAGVRASFEDPISYIKDNTIATTNVANFCKNNDVSKMILASTSSIYGNSGDKEMVEDVDEKINPPSIYASTKLSGETLAKTILSEHDTNLIITRFFTVYGPYGRPDMSILRFIHWIMENQNLIIFGDGEQKRSFTFIGDVVEFLIKAQNCNGSETFNIGNNKTSSLNEVVGIIEKVSGKKANVVNKPRAFRDPDVVLPSLNKSKEILEWEPTTNIEDGIKLTIEWYSTFQDTIKDFEYIK